MHITPINFFRSGVVSWTVMIPCLLVDLSTKKFECGIWKHSKFNLFWKDTRVQLLFWKFVNSQVQIYCVKFSPDSSRIISGSEDKTLRVWDLKTKKCLAVLAGHTDYVMRIKPPALNFSGELCESHHWWKYPHFWFKRCHSETMGHLCSIPSSRIWNRGKQCQLFGPIESTSEGKLSTQKFHGRGAVSTDISLTFM